MDELIIEAFSVQAGKLLCPVCSAKEYEPDQPMMAYGDYPGMLFCPHCELGIAFSTPALDRPSKNTFWIKHCLETFIRRFSNGG